MPWNVSGGDGGWPGVWLTRRSNRYLSRGHFYSTVCRDRRHLPSVAGKERGNEPCLRLSQVLYRGGLADAHLLRELLAVDLTRVLVVAILFCRDQQVPLSRRERRPFPEKEASSKITFRTSP